MTKKKSKTKKSKKKGISLKSGKADFVTRRLPNGKKEKVCLCDYNADFSVRGCISQVPGHLVQDVIDNNGQYSEEVKKKLRDENNGKLPSEQCLYCYAKRHNYGRVTPIGVGEKTRKDFEEKKPEFVRVGKNNEAGHPLYRDNLLEFMELCKEFGSRVILIQKMLEFDKRVARLFQKTDSVIQYSIGWDKLEPGACSQGFTNAWRIKQARKYARAGVNTTLTIVCDVTSSIEDNIKRGNAIGLALRKTKTDITRRLIPLRIEDKRVCLETTGMDWEEVKHSKPFPEDGHASFLSDEYTEELERAADQIPYSLEAGGKLIARFFHPDFHGFRDSLSVCGRVGDTEYCDKCNLGLERVSFPVSELVKVQYADEKRESRKKYREKKKHKKQLKLF